MFKSIQNPYWINPQQVTTKSNDFNAIFALKVEEFQVNSGMLDVQTHKLTEYQIIREILWTLRCPVETPLFKIVNAFKKNGEVGPASLKKIHILETS